jgi:hypothetical protein
VQAGCLEVLFSEGKGFHISCILQMWVGAVQFLRCFYIIIPSGPVLGFILLVLISLTTTPYLSAAERNTILFWPTAYFSNLSALPLLQIFTINLVISSQ